MGTSCCVADRHGNKSPKKEKHKRALAIESPKTPEMVEKSPKPKFGKSSDFNEKFFKTPVLYKEPDPDIEIIVDFYWSSANDFPRFWEKELLESQKVVTPPDSKDSSARPLPFLIAPFSDDKDYAVICSKPCPLLYRTQIHQLPAEQLVERCVQRKFACQSMEEAVFCDEVSTFLKYFSFYKSNSKAAAEGLEPLGCINDFTNNYVFYFFFFKTGFVPIEDGGDDGYACLPLKTAEPEQAAIVLENWANVHELCYKLSFPVYKPSFAEVKFQAIVLRRPGIGERFNYFIVESDPIEELYNKVNIVDSQQEFVGLITYPKMSYIVYDISDKHNEE